MYIEKFVSKPRYIDLYELISRGTAKINVNLVFKDLLLRLSNFKNSGTAKSRE